MFIDYNKYPLEIFMVNCSSLQWANSNTYLDKTLHKCILYHPHDTWLVSMTTPNNKTASGSFPENHFFIFTLANNSRDSAIFFILFSSSLLLCSQLERCMWICDFVHMFIFSISMNCLWHYSLKLLLQIY